MSKRPTNAKTTSSVSSKTSSSSKTTSSGSVSKSVPKSRAASKSPQPSRTKTEVITKDKADIKTESKDVNNNLLTPDKDQKSTDLNKQDDTKQVEPAPDQQTTLINQVPSKPSELDSELIIDVQPPSEDVSEKAKTTKSIKRKPSTQHRNSKQDTAQLLRRKSLTPSTKLSMIINW